jgi:hypothetical protein
VITVVTVVLVFADQLNLFPHESPTSQDLDEVAQKIAARVSRYLEKAGYLIRDAESEYLDLYSDAEDATRVWKQ